MTPPLSVPTVTSPPWSMWIDEAGRKLPELTGEGSADDAGIVVVVGDGKMWM